jgi:hypothetical protein
VSARKTVLRMVEFKPDNQAESDAFVRRIAECKSQEEVRKVIDATRELLSAAPKGK